MGTGTFFLILFITIINICAWIAFFIKFKNLFSTEGIVEETKNEMNHIIRDINSNTLQAVRLVDEKIRQLQSISLSVDEKIAKAEKLLNSKEFKDLDKRTLREGMEKIDDMVSRSQKPISEPAAREPLRTSAKTFDPGNKAYEVLQQGLLDLFDDIPESPSNKIPTSDGAVVVRNDGASYTKVPVVEMKEVEPPKENPPENKNAEEKKSEVKEEKSDFAAQVRALHAEGKSDSEIASILGCSPVEVELVLSI